MQKMETFPLKDIDDVDQTEAMKKELCIRIV
jgi:hypothetical protein